MTDHKFTDDEVIHHLDCYENLGYRWCGYAIALINRQKAEIESLNAAHADMTESLRLASEANKDMSVELDAMRGAANSYKMHYENAINEFAEAVKMEFYREFDEIIPSIMADKIDKLVKERIKENK